MCSRNQTENVSFAHLIRSANDDDLCIISASLSYICVYIWYRVICDYTNILIHKIEVIMEEFT